MKLLLAVLLVGCLAELGLSQRRYDVYNSYYDDYVRNNCYDQIQEYNMTRRFQEDWSERIREWQGSSGDVDETILNYFRELEVRAGVAVEEPTTTRPIGLADPHLSFFARTARQKRQAIRVRKEYRSLTSAERTAYHNAVKALKYNMLPTFPPISVYDVFAAVHNIITSPGAHGGPMFLPWHRHFLYLYETALAAHDPSVALPYWNSAIDSSLASPSTSIMWTQDYMGNAAGGLVTSGPFSSGAGWNIYRNSNFNPSVLYNEGSINNLLSNTPFSSFYGPMEWDHGGPHVYIGGNMANIITAAQDPLFFMHHAFVDCLWEEWRNDVQIPAGYDPQVDYPSNAATTPDNYLNAQMKPWQVTTHHGLSSFYSRYYRCAPRVPTSSGCNCCDGSSTPNGNYASYSATPYYPPAPQPDYRQVYFRLRIDYQGSNPYLETTYRPYDPYTRPQEYQYTTTQDYPSYTRPQEYPSNSQQGSGCCGGTDYVYADCQGRDYNRYYRDYTGYDHRTPVSRGYTYLSMPHPDSGHGDCQLRVYTPNGRPCTPMCLIRGTYPPRYQPCCGILNLRDNGLTYYNSYREAIRGGLEYDVREDYPIYYDTDQQYDSMVFYCRSDDPYAQQTYKGKK